MTLILNYNELYEDMLKFLERKGVDPTDLVAYRIAKEMAKESEEQEEDEETVQEVIFEAIEELGLDKRIEELVIHRDPEGIPS